jgi:hypothetical protein
VVRLTPEGQVFYEEALKTLAQASGPLPRRSARPRGRSEGWESVSLDLPRPHSSRICCANTRLGIIAALALGAEGVQMGTVFLACEESGAHALHREAILSGRAGRTALTKGFTGRLARGIDNELLQMLNKPGTEILPYPLQRSLMRNLAFPAQKAGRADLCRWRGKTIQWRALLS